MMAEDDYQFLIGQTLVCLRLLLPADLHEVREKTIDFVSSCFNHVSVTATMSRVLDVTYSEKGAVLGLIDRTFIVAILILSFKLEGPGFKLTSPASRSKMANLKFGREGGSGSNFRLKHTFKRANFALTRFDTITLHAKLFCTIFRPFTSWIFNAKSRLN